MKKEEIKNNINRMQELVNAFQNGQSFAIHGNLSRIGSGELPEGFHKIPEYKGFICECGTAGYFDKESFIQKVLQHAKKTKKPVLILDNHLIYEITPNMDLKKALQKQKETNESFADFLKRYDHEKESIRNTEKEQHQKLSITNQPLWDKLMEEKRNAPFVDFVPREFSKNSEARIERLQLYARILEGRREKEGRITPSIIAHADNIADLSVDLRKISRNDPTLPEVRFEGLRFWADIILAKTWKYGDELLTAEGFSKEEINAIKTHPTLPIRYTYWESLSHPHMTDTRVTEFWRGEKETTITSHHRTKIPQIKEKQRD